MGILAFLYGLIFGSFYNVVIYRIPADKSIAKGRSMCGSCDHTLAAKDLVPVFSWIFLKAKCRYCGSKISMRYPIIELTTGFLFLLAYMQSGSIWEFIFYASLWSMLLITAIIDYDEMIISDAVLLAFTIVGIVALIGMKAGLLTRVYGSVFGFGFYFAIYYIAKLIYKKEAFGFGDVMLMGALGVFLGFRDAVMTSILSFYVALVIIVIMKLFGKKTGLRQEIPFGPYICIAAFIVSLYGNQLVEMYFELFLY